MKKNIELNVAYIQNDSDSICVCSLNESVLSDYIISIDKEDPFTKKRFSIYIDKLIIKSKSMKDIHDAVSDICEAGKLYTFKYISNKSELFTCLKIKAGMYKSDSTCDDFLIENGFLNDWIDGKLKVQICHFYKESSRDFGFKSKISKEFLNIDSYEKIWNFHELFDGKTKEYKNYEAKYSYTNESRIISVIKDNIKYDVNKLWLEEVDPVQKSYCFN